MLKSTTAATFACIAVLAASLATAQPTSERRRPNFDIRVLRSRVSAVAGDAAGSTRQAQAVTASARLASMTGVDGSNLQHSLTSRGRVKLLAATSSALTGPSPDEPKEIAATWLSQYFELFGYSEQELQAMNVAVREASLGLRFVEFEQVVDGLPVFRSGVRVTIDSLGQIIQVQGPTAQPATGVQAYDDAGPQAAIGAAFQSVGVAADQTTEWLADRGTGRGTYSNPESPELSPVSVRLVAFTFETGIARAAYRVTATTSVGAYDVIVAADNGQLLYRVDLRSQFGRARVWATTPLGGDREFKDLPDTWLADGETTTSGNQADAFLDTDGDDEPDNTNRGGLKSGRAFSADQEFDFDAGDGFEDPSSFVAQAVVNAFYHANAAHDHFYQLGFREPDGNFQADNFGKGGVSGDPVMVSVHSSVADDNAFFSTPPDGTPGVMHLGISTLANDGRFRDSSLSADVVFHEYGHGVTNRLIGGPFDSACLSLPQGTALGEAWSDYFASSRFDQPVVGPYYSGDPEGGIRRHRLDEMPWTFSDLANDGLESHNDGEIFAAVLWDIRTALGPEVTDALVYSALPLTPCEPTFLQARDAILTADLAFNGGVNRQVLWTMFAARGMGVGAHTDGAPFDPAWVRFDSTNDISVEFGGDPNRSPVITSNLGDLAIVGETEHYTVRAQDPDGDDWTVLMLEAPAGAVFDPDLRRVRWRPNFVAGRFVFSVTDSFGNETRHGFIWTTFALLDLQSSLTINGSQGSFGYGGFLLDSPADVLQVTLRGGIGDADLTVFDTGFEFANSYKVGPDETLSFVDPFPGPWFVIVDGLEDFNGIRLKARTVEAQVIDSESPVSDMFDANTGERIFSFAVPESADTLRAQLRGASGNADLYVAEGRIPVCPPESSLFCDFDASSDALGSYEAVEIDNPTAGDWFINVTALEAYEDLTLTVSTVANPATVSAATEGAAFDPLVAPGGISTLFGSGFTEPGIQAVATSIPLETELVGIQVFVDGVPAPLYFVSETQINFQMPFESALESVNIVVIRDGQVSLSFEATVEQDVPRLFSFVLEEQVEPIITHADGSIVTPTNGAESGETLIAYLTGVGDLLSPPETGAAAGSNPLSTTTVTPTVVVNGVEVTADFSGLTPGLVGLVQVNFRMPEGLPSGTRVSIEIRYGDVATQAMTIAIK